VFGGSVYSLNEVGAIKIYPSQLTDYQLTTKYHPVRPQSFIFILL